MLTYYTSCKKKLEVGFYQKTNFTQHATDFVNYVWVL